MCYIQMVVKNIKIGIFMSKIYAISDIHGYYDILEINLNKINFSERDTKLIFCGDYIDYGPDSCRVLY